MVHRFGHQRDARHVAESSDEIIAGKLAVELAVHKTPALSLGEQRFNLGFGKFFCCMSHSSGIGWRSFQLLCGASSAQQQFQLRPASCKRCERSERFFVECAREFHYCKVSSEAKNARYTRRKLKVENHVKKKIRAVQYGVGPIGASIVRLMRENRPLKSSARSIRIRRRPGAILAKWPVRRTAPWGVKVSAEAKRSIGTKRGRGDPFDVVFARASNGPVTDVPGSGVLHCFDLRRLSYPFRTYPELAAKLDSAAKEWGVALIGTGVNPGFVMDKLVVTLAAVSQRIEHAKALRVVDASKRRLPLQKKSARE